MPAAIVTTPTVVRDLHDDEKLVLDEFERHVRHCTQCELALENDDNTQCERGHLLAVDVTQYLYSESGRYFAQVDKEAGKPTRVKLPRDSSSTRYLLESVEHGMRLSSPRRGRAPPVRPPSSRSNTSSRSANSPRPIVQQVRPRSRTPETRASPTTIIERSPSTGKRPVIVYQSPRVSPSRSSSNRGSLYINDNMDREERRTRVYLNTHR
ncbi:hypothetical protein N7468_007269 [Penicillium chermesinum]|uniref:Uncharacterized protein n=1 Tax=Penicillium chermesinum TaxID=63820 RepID=A0A9W9NWP6_9EURO|nr:uncharacterized protein N7468_007269 [Penicillium chermesinum]KAJ5226044.1 hypothetical protein N7468_007269 [Penicillium chermesinum]KAJ6160761.1 hypothetical protein N7470_004157 [Penicillium chermesinum]